MLFLKRTIFYFENNIGSKKLLVDNGQFVLITLTEFLFLLFSNHHHFVY